MMSEGISLFVTVFTVINIAACLWLLWWTARTRSKPAAGAPTEKTGHVWDGDLEEYNNPLPRWWLGLFVITVLFGACYLALYPGLGNFSGAARWSQTRQYEQQVAAARESFEARLAAFKDQPLEVLAADAGAMATAQNLFGANCAACHGSDGRGAKGFPNLADRDWLWGGDEKLIYESVAGGRHGIMPALGGALGTEGVNEAASYVMSLSGGKAPPDWVAAGATRFATVCAACHGADARGNPLLGAPNLTDRIWLHGGDFDSIRATISNGRDSQMPAHLPLLGETKVRLLAAYVLSLGLAPASNEPPAAVARNVSVEEPAHAGSH